MHTYVSVIGNLTRDVELRYTPSGLAIGNTAIASTYKYTINNEKKKQEINEKETPNEREEQAEKTEYVQGE